MSREKNKQVENTIPAGYTLDYVSGKQVKETKKELVRQRVVRALIHEYGFSPEDMELDFSIGGRKKVDVAIFHHGKEHTIENLGRAVLCRQEPNVGKNAVRIRDFEQAAKDLDEIETIMREVDAVQYGLWTNGLEFFFVEKEQKRFETKCNPIGDWPMAEESVGTKEVISDAHTRIADNEMLKITFRRCHNYIHGNEGMPKDAAFWQFLYLIFCKMHDENLRGKQRQAWKRRFWAGPKEQFEPQGRKAIRARIEELFTEVKKQYKNIFRGNEEITLSDRALAFIVSELAKYDFTRTDVDAKGVAYQELVGVNLRGDRGQYFTPRGVVKLVVEMLEPKESETVLDPACGTGGFLVATLGHMLKKYREEQHTQPGNENTTEFLNVHERLKEYAAANVFGADFDPFLIRAAQMNMVLAGTCTFTTSTPEFPLGHWPIALRQEEILGSVDIIATNPPFGSDIPITDKHILEQYELAHAWEPTKAAATPAPQGQRRAGISLYRALHQVAQAGHWSHGHRPARRRSRQPGGGIHPLVDHVKPRCSPPSICRWSIHRRANVNILPACCSCAARVKRKRAEALGGIENIRSSSGRQGWLRPSWQQALQAHPDGEEIVEPKQHIERIRIGGRFVERTLTRSEKIETTICRSSLKYRGSQGAERMSDQTTSLKPAGCCRRAARIIFIDILTGKESASARKLPAQKVSHGSRG